MNLLLWLFQTSNAVCFDKMIGGSELEGKVPREFGEYCLNLKMDDVENSLEIRSPMTVKKYESIELINTRRIVPFSDTQGFSLSPVVRLGWEMLLVAIYQETEGTSRWFSQR